MDTSEAWSGVVVNNVILTAFFPHGGRKIDGKRTWDFVIQGTVGAILIVFITEHSRQDTRFKQVDEELPV